MSNCVWEMTVIVPIWVRHNYCFLNCAQLTALSNSSKIFEIVRTQLGFYILWRVFSHSKPLAMAFRFTFIDLSDVLIQNDLQMKNTKSEHILGEFLALHDWGHLQYYDMNPWFFSLISWQLEESFRSGAHLVQGWVKCHSLILEIHKPLMGRLIHNNCLVS